MDFEKEDNIKPDDLVSEYSLASGGSFRLVCDSKSLLYLFGMQLDWSPALGGLRAGPCRRSTAGRAGEGAIGGRRGQLAGDVAQDGSASA